MSPTRVGAAQRAAALPFDFNGDGYAELVVGVPGEKIGHRPAAGQVNVLRGTPSGPTADGDQVWQESRKGVAGTAERLDNFGAAVASADFDRDGFADLAVGVPGETINPKPGTGAVHVFYGSRKGLTASRDRVWHQGRKGIVGPNEAFDDFGRSLAVGDFDGDGYADLAIGVPGEDIGAVPDAGRVVLLRGSNAGLTATGAQSFDQTTPGIADEPGDNGPNEPGESFGWALATGDVNADGRDDLAIGVPGDMRRGAVHVLLGSPAGLTATGSQYLTPEAYAGSASGAREQFARSVALGDFNADGRADLAIGRPAADPPPVQNPDPADSLGWVTVLYAGLGGQFSASARQQWTGFYAGPRDQYDAGPLGPIGIYAGFGAHLATGDLTGDGVADLVIGSPGMGSWESRRAGAVHVLTGTSAGLVAGTVLIAQGYEVVPGTFEAGDRCGSSVAAARLGGGAADWVVVGCRGETIGSEADAGTVLVVPGSPGGPLLGGSSEWNQSTPGVRGAAERGDLFGTVAGFSAT